MNKNIFQFITILILFVFSIGSFAQDNRTLDTKVADILAQMPTNDLIHRDRVMAEIVELGPEGFRKMAELLTPAGVGDDTAVRFAINSVARYASDFGREEERSYVETGLLNAIQQQTNNEVITFLMNQLNLVGGQESVKALQVYLTDEDLAEPATQALLSIGNKEAAMALLSGLSNANEKTEVTLVRALGQLNCKTALPEITRLADTENPELRKVSLEALASIGDPDSYKLMLDAAKDVDFEYEPTHAAENFLNYADRLAENNEQELAEKALKAVFKANSAGEKLHNYSKALAISTKHFGYEALPLLLNAMDNSSKPFRYSALNLAENLGGIAATRQWVEKAKSASPEVKAEIISMLGRRGDEYAVDFVKSNLEASMPVVREEAITALVKLQGTEAVPVLIAHLTEGNDLTATKIALFQLLDKAHLALVAAQLGETSGEVKAAFVEIIGAKSGSQYFDEIYALTDAQKDEVRAAAFAALQNVSSYDNINELIDKLLAVQNKNEIEAVQAAIVAAIKDVDIESTENGQLLQALDRTSKKERIVAILPEIGGDVALQNVVDYFGNSSGSLKETAFEALASWKDYSAADALYEVAQNSTGEYRAKAFSNFTRMVRNANLPDDQKLLQYRKIMPFATSANDKRLVINAIGNLKTFLSMVYLEDFLDDSELQQTAARAIMRIALPDNNGQNGFAGEKVRELLKRVTTILEGEESDYDIININNYLQEMPDEKGFVSMFNGKNLDGWQGMLLDGNPIKIAQLSEAERAKAQEEANKKMHEFWTVKDNTIVFNGNGANLVSVKDYGDFELIVDWRITKNGDSGIYLRGTPQVQIWDTSRVEVGAQVGSGGLYNNQKYESKPLKVADNPIGEWNTFHITMIGENVTVYLNGELVVDNVPLENYWDRSQPIFPTGPIELQAHGTNLAFRDIYVKEINTDEIGLTEKEKAEGFVSLFNGRNLDGWQGNKTDYYAENGELVVNPKRGGHGNLYTEKEYSDFIFRFEFQLTPGANNGLGVRAPLEGDAAYVGMELQILDNTAPIYANLHEYQYHGSVYGVIPAKRGFQNPVGDWNTQEVILKGNDIKITLNGEVILEGNIDEAGKNGTLDGKPHPGLDREKGYIGFLGHGSPLKFRNIKIKDLSE
jgi:HEAT repeat protein